MPTRQAFGEELRRRRTARKMTQGVAARGLGVQRATLTQWESGTHLPSAEKVRAADDYFGARGALIALADAARTGAAPHAAPRKLTLDEVFIAVGRTLRARLQPAEGDRPPGWCHDLAQRATPTPLSTAYGIRTLLMLDGPGVDLRPLARFIWHRHGEGGWVIRHAGPPRPEATAAMVDALTRVALDVDLDDAWCGLERSVDDHARAHPFVLCVVLETAARFRPTEPFTAQLVDHLLAARRRFDDAELWPANATVDPRRIEPSMVHTARAVAALRAAQHQLHRDDVAEAVDQAVRWITDTEQDDGVTEVLRPDPANRSADVPINHFTAAWVVRALAGHPGVPGPRMNAALQRLWDSYLPDDALWGWKHDGQIPLWMAHDAVAALRAAALAGFPTPVVVPTAGE
ncbi:MAG TPA: helix-turn-helix transcriptional regulator [Pseudonocardia sp.]|jgi:transcriptional regulator with XRE-family HTH domain|nr:helix-turn-helix transcriptional regulator [Pseudonocardia sp.]